MAWERLSDGPRLLAPNILLIGLKWFANNAINNSGVTVTQSLLMNSGPEYIVLDFETTGFEPGPSEIIEIGALHMRGFEILSRYERLVRPSRPIPAVITQITGITQESVKDAPEFKEVQEEFMRFVDGLPVIAHNASMEQRFLDHFVGRLPGPYPLVQDSIEPLALALPERGSYSLENLRIWADIDTSGAHRAGKDAEDVVRVLEKAHALLGGERVAIAKIVREIFPKELFADWWWSWFFQTASLAARSPSLPNETQQETLEPAAIRDLSSAFREKPPALDLEKRDSQEKMAHATAETLEDGGRLAIEAPTGVGKSLGYLLPGALFAREHDEPIVVATHTRSLQDQLIRKDIPILRRWIGEVSAAIVKGQENYLCLRKLHEATAQAQHGGVPLSRDEAWSIAFLHAYSSVSRAAEVGHVSRFLKGAFPALEAWVERSRSHHTTTIGPKCPFYKSCHFFNSARAAADADVIVANHALAFQWPSHLPKAERWIFDEAHHLEEQLTDANSLRLTAHDLNSVLERLGAGRGQPSRELSAVQNATSVEATARLIKACSDARELSGEITTGIPEEITADFGLSSPKGAVSELLPRLQALEQKITDALSELTKLTEGITAERSFASDVLVTEIDRLARAKSFLSGFTDTDRKELLRSFQSTRDEWRAALIPIEVSAFGRAFFESRKSVILTSATLATPSSKEFLLKRIGFDSTRPLLSLPSPYALERQATAFIPQDAAPPGTDLHLEQLIDFTESCARKLGGRTLLLITANHRLRSAAEELRARLEADGISVFDSWSDSHAAENFRSTKRAVLVGSERMGEGIDIPGPALSLVIIEKINESMTRGALAESRKARTKFGLYDYDFPLRMIWLKQRVGRLIRSKQDTGSIVVFDPRYFAWAPRSRSFVKETLAPIPLKESTRAEILAALDAAPKESSG